jgi:hypothetical protein
MNGGRGIPGWRCQHLILFVRRSIPGLMHTSFRVTGVLADLARLDRGGNG